MSPAAQGAQPVVLLDLPGVGAHDQQPHEVQAAAAVLAVGHQPPDDGGHEFRAVDTFLAHDGVQSRGVEQHLTPDEHQGAAGAQGAHQVAGEDVEGRARHLQVHGDITVEAVLRAPGFVG
ncbi:hypothetical protein GCM10023238_08740 [Streptomyces heliomycini]